MKTIVVILSIITGSFAGLWYAATLNDTPSIVSQLQEDISALTERLNDISSSNLGAFNPSGGLTYRLQTSVGTTDTTINLSSFKNRSGIPLTLANLETDKIYGTLSPQTSRSEFVSCTGITQNANGTASLTSCTRGLSDIAPFTASTTLRQSHPGQSVFILSDSPNFFEEYARVRNNQLVTGNWMWASTSYPGYVSVPTAHSLGNPASSSAEFASVGYVNAISIAGASNASESAKGIVELATQTEAASSSSTGTSGASLVLQARHATDTPNTATRASRILMSDAAGYLKNTWLDLSSHFSLTSLFATRASSTNATTTSLDVTGLARFTGSGTTTFFGHEVVLGNSSTTNLVISNDCFGCSLSDRYLSSTTAFSVSTGAITYYGHRSAKEAYFVYSVTLSAGDSPQDGAVLLPKNGANNITESKTASGAGNGHCKYRYEWSGTDIIVTEVTEATVTCSVTGTVYWYK